MIVEDASLNNAIDGEMRLPHISDFLEAKGSKCIFCVDGIDVLPQNAGIRPQSAGNLVVADLEDVLVINPTLKRSREWCIPNTTAISPVALAEPMEVILNWTVQFAVMNYNRANIIIIEQHS
jgi:hypothetical protein